MRRRFVLTVVCGIGLALALAGCGGGGNKAKTGYPAAGEDTFENTKATVQIEITPAGASAQGGPSLQQTETVELQGPARITRGEPTQDGDVFVVPTEIVKMELTGTASFGQVVVHESQDEQSLGEVRQQEKGKDYPAASFFDVFVVVDVPDLQLTLHNKEAMHMAAELHDLPPAEGDAYMGTDDRPLYTPAGLQVGRIIDALHIPNPPPPGGGGTEEPTSKATQEPTRGEATATQPSGGGEVKATQTLRCVHTKPGEYSDVFDAILLAFVGAEPVEGATVQVAFDGPGIQTPSVTGVTDASGEVELDGRITRLGGYTETIESVMLADGTEATLSADSDLTASLEVGQVC